MGLRLSSHDMILEQARELNRKSDYAKTIKLLSGIGIEATTNPYYCFHYGFALHESHREHEAVEYFKKAKESGLEEIDELPNTFYPKSVTTWLERAERNAPQRLEQNEFESERRAKRLSSEKEINYETFDFEDFWYDCDFSKKSFWGKTPTDNDIAQAESILGYKLPDSYKNLIKRHNGGLLKRNHFENPLKRDWVQETFAIESIHGVDNTKMYSLYGESGTKFWINEWGYPDIGVVIGEDLYAHAHCLFFLDYSDCGPKGEPCVVYISQERNYEITYLADNFALFVQGLMPSEEEDYD